jgi:hypothetical protein
MEDLWAPKTYFGRGQKRKIPAKNQASSIQTTALTTTVTELHKLCGKTILSLKLNPL